MLPGQSRRRTSPLSRPHGRCWTAVGAVILAGALPVLAGCAEDTYEREAAYPGQAPVGTTMPPSAPGESVANMADGPEAPRMAAPEDSLPPMPPADDSYADSDPSALQDFRGALDPYGSWQDDPTYGTVWVPSPSVVGSDFAPYVSAGHWSYDDDEYAWVSDYDWGWAPFHYGRWVYASNAWSWIPGRRYAGAWVSWRYGAGDWGYVGWAPLAPTWGWRRGVAYRLGFAPQMPYSFVANGQLFAPHVGAALMVGPQVAAIGANTRPWLGSGRITARPTVGGPPPEVLRIPESGIVRGASSNRGILQARAFSRPSTAVALGGSVPRFGARSTSPAAWRGPSSIGPAGGYQAAPSHFGGKLGAGFSGAGAANGYAPRAYDGPARSFSPAGGGFAGARGGASTYSAPASHFSGGSMHSGGGTFHGGGSARVGGGFHGGGGGHGGGRR